MEKIEIILGVPAHRPYAGKVEEMIAAEAAKKNMLKWIASDIGEAIDGGNAVLALAGVEIVGFIFLLPWRAYTEIVALIVAPRHRKKGIGLALMEKAVVLAGIKYPEKSVILLSNKISYHIGEKLGFVHVAKEFLDKEVWEDCAYCENRATCHCQPMILDKPSVRPVKRKM